MMDEVNEFKYLVTVLCNHEWMEEVKGKAVTYRFSYKLYERKGCVSGSEEVLMNISYRQIFVC